MSTVDPSLVELVLQLFETTDVGLAIVDRDLRLLAVNAMVAALTGMTPAEHRGRLVSDLVRDPLILARLEAAARSVFETGCAVERLELVLAGPDAGSSRTFVLRQWPLSTDGEVRAVGVKIVDVTRQRLAEEALARSETQFRAICEASPVGIFLTDPHGGNLYANPTHLAQLGLTGEQTRGFGWANAVHPDEVEATRELYRTATTSGRLYQGVSRLVHPDGSIVVVDVKMTAVTDAGQIIGWVGMSEDITERLEGDAQRRESDLRFRQLAENIGSTFWLASADRTALYYVSPAFERMWGRTVADVMKGPEVFVSSIHPDDRDRVLARLAIRAEEPYEHEYRIVRPDGTVVWIHDRGFPVRDESGTLVRLAGIATDVTAHKALEARLLQSQKLDSIGRLAGGVAHDFNNLLTVILNQAAMAIRAAERGEPVREELAHVEDAAKQAAEVTRQLLAFARQQASRPSLVDPNELAESVLRFLRRVIGEQIELVVDGQPDIGVVRVDRGQLEQVLVNLALNARDAMPGGGCLTVQTRNVELLAPRTADDPVPAGSWVLVRVVDTGTGIPKADQPHIFEPFFSTKAPGEGTGLGLASCWGIVKQHGGYVVVESELGLGTTFELYFPRVDSLPDPVPSARTPVPAPDGSGVVLVVEDEASVRAIAARALREHGFDVLEAGNGEEALVVLAEHEGAVDLVVTDVVMPKMGGAELGAAIRERYASVPVLFTSGYPPQGSFADDGAPEPFLPKPYVVPDLLRAVRKVLQDRARRH